MTLKTTFARHALHLTDTPVASFSLVFNKAGEGAYTNEYGGQSNLTTGQTSTPTEPHDHFNF